MDSSKNIPEILEALTEKNSNKKIISSRIIHNEANSTTLHTGYIPIFHGLTGTGVLYQYIESRREKRLTHLILENKQKIDISNIKGSKPVLIDAMENNRNTIFIANRKNEVEDAIIIPEAQENDLQKFSDILLKNNRVFFKYNSIWNIRYNQEFIQFNDFKGPNYVHYLLQNPYKECTLWELYTAINKPDYEAINAVSDPNANLKFTDEEEKDKIQNKSSSYNYVNEAYNTLYKYRKEVRKCDDLIKKYEAGDDTGMLPRIEKLKHDREILVKEMKRIKNEIKFKNFTRNTDNRNEEKVRQSISQAYKQFRNALDKEKTSNLHKHLTRSIVTGNTYKYDPEGSDINWMLDL